MRCAPHDAFIGCFAAWCLSADVSLRCVSPDMTLTSSGATRFVPVRNEPARIGGERKLQMFRWGGAYLLQVFRELYHFG
jgi:hypothetical protein